MSPAYRRLWQAIADLSEAGGKRLRPCMVLMSYRAHAPKAALSETVMPAAIAFELLHLAMLVHDDIIDRDYIRYGRKNIAAQYLDTYRHFLDGSDLEHFSQSAAILAGDVLLSQAHGVLQRCDVSTDLIALAQIDLSRCVLEVTGGELMDTEASFMTKEPVSPLAIARYKTASYSFIGPLIMGAHLAAAPEKQIELLRNFGEKIGIAYQIRDDLLGIFGREELTGKSTLGDIREGKHTYLVEQFLTYASSEEKAIFTGIFGKQGCTTAEAQVVCDLFTTSGARTAAEDYIEDLARQARNMLQEFAISSEDKQLFEHLVQLSIRRDF